MKLPPSFLGATSGIASVASNFAAKRTAIGKLRPDKLAVVAVNIGGGDLNYGWGSHNVVFPYVTILPYFSAFVNNFFRYSAFFYQIVGLYRKYEF
jgi:hypothetical protein